MSDDETLTVRGEAVLADGDNAGKRRLIGGRKCAICLRKPCIEGVKRQVVVSGERLDAHVKGDTGELDHPWQGGSSAKGGKGGVDGAGNGRIGIDKRAIKVPDNSLKHSLSCRCYDPIVDAVMESSTLQS